MAYLLAHMIRAVACSIPLFLLALLVQNIGYPSFLPHNTYGVTLAACLALEVGFWRASMAKLS